MPIYEFYCKTCNTVYNFFSKTINTSKIPDCPNCNHVKLVRQLSCFSIAKNSENNDANDIPIDEAKIDNAMQRLAQEVESIDDNNPKQAAGLMQKLSDMTGMSLNKNMKEAIQRMVSGEDPEKVEADMGDILNTEEPFEFPEKKSNKNNTFVQPPRIDEKLYDL
ncbi:cytochrome C [Candidatus Magnetomorum sp. HK-1]|nr:cytochrome C [Candidatus Magnetomorum sp. HK-1]